MAPAATRMAAGALLLLVLLIPVSHAQAPGLPAEIARGALALNIQCLDTMLEPDYAGQDTVTCTVEDLSRDAVFVQGGSGTGPTGHIVTFTSRPAPGFENVTGYQVLITDPNMYLKGGDRRTTDINVKATPQVNSQDYSFEVVAVYRHNEANYEQTFIIPFNAQVNHYDFALLSWSGNTATQRAGQDEVVVYSVAIENTGVYPDIYRFTVTAKPDLRVTRPSNVYVGPGETRVVNISLLTPHGKLFEVGRSETIGIKITSMGVGGVSGTGAYSVTGTLQIRGPYIPIYWIPLFAVGLISMGVVVRGARDKGERRAKERGAPRRVDLTPRQTVLLAQMRKQDPETYKEKRKALETVYVERRQDYRAHRKERLAADREEAKQAKVEFAAQKKARKAKQADAKQEAREARKAAKFEAKLVKKKQKVLAKTRKAIEKAKAKEAKRDAKIAKKQAKIDAKQAKTDAEAAKKAEKLAKKQQKKK